jgi:type IV pilus assembly protein PilO
MSLDLNFDFDFDLSDIDWDLNAAGQWPKPIRVGFIALCCAAVIGAGIYYDTVSQLEALDVLQKKEVELKATFEFKNAQAANLPAYEEQLEVIKHKLQSIIKQMPLQEEVAGLLIDISQTGLSSGLEFKLFKPAPPVKQDFYSELPINIEVMGKYEELLLFVSGLASLPRIVTIHDLTIAPADKNSKVTKQSAMLMSVLIKTYYENPNTDAKNNAK